MRLCELACRHKCRIAGNCHFDKARMLIKTVHSILYGVGGLCGGLWRQLSLKWPGYCVFLIYIFNYLQHNAMIVILKRISAVTSVPDIESFIEPVIKGGLFKKAGEIKSLKIQMLQQPGAGREEYHAIVRIEPDVVAERVIRTLNRKPCAGKPINVSEFHTRLYANDRRESQDSCFQDARKADRRRKNLLIKDLASDKIGTAINNGALTLAL